MTRLGPLLSPILIGRDELLELAERRLAEAAAGRGQFLLLAGEAGVGKSRLMSGVEAKARAERFETAAGFLAPQDRDVPCAAILDMARSMTRFPRWERLGRDLLGLADEAVSAPQPRRRLLVLKVVDLLLGAVEAPTLLSFDDLQWADNLTLEILAEVARSARTRPLLLVAAYRTDEIGPGAPLREWRSRLLTQRLAEEARLTPLTREQTALMTTLILGTGLPAPRDVVAAVYARTDGVPLHIEELLGAIGEDERRDSRAILDAAVPDTLEDAILQRVGRLSPEAQAVARSGAVIGRCFVPDVLAGIMDVPVASLDRPLRELVDEHVLEPPGLRGLFDFRHQLLRDALYRDLDESERRRLHARAGEFGRRLEGASEIHASLHFARAGMKAEAFRSALQGARIAARLSSHREAFELFARAVENLPAELAQVEQAEILDAYAVEAAAIEEIDTCESAAAKAAELYREAGDTAAAVDQLALIAGMARRRARPIEVRRGLVMDAIAQLVAAPDSGRAAHARATLFIELAYVSIEGLRLDDARVALDAALAVTAAAGDEALGYWARSVEGLLEVVSGRPPVGLDAMGRVAREARDRGFEDTGVTAYRDAAVAAARMMEYGRSARWIEEGVRYADAIEQSHCAHVMGALGSLVAWADGRWDDAVAGGQRALADRGCARGAGMARWPLAYVALGRGELDEAAGHLEAADSFARAAGAPDMILAAAWGSAERSMLAGGRSEAIAITADALEVARASGERGQLMPIVVAGMRARLSAGLPGEAERWLGDVTETLVPIRPHAAAALDHAAGLLELATGSTSAARVLLERAARGWDEKPRRWEAAWARLDLAACLLRMSRHRDAAAVVAEVRALAEHLRSRPLLDRAEELSRLNRRRGVEETAWHPLTAREFEVARLIANGLTNAEIAGRLSVSPRTVSAHVEHVLGKLGAARRTEIASWVATRAGAGTPGEPGGLGRAAPFDRSSEPERRPAIPPV